MSGKGWAAGSFGASGVGTLRSGTGSSVLGGSVEEVSSMIVRKMSFICKSDCLREGDKGVTGDRGVGCNKALVMS